MSEASRSNADGEPSRSVLAAFGLSEVNMQPLPGGEEVSVFGGGVVLKNVQGADVSAWCQALLASAEGSDEFRLPRPLLSHDGRWEVDSWTATEFVDGLTSLRHDPATIVRVGESLSDVLTEANRSDSSPVQQRQDRWARADRFVWGEEMVELRGEASDIAATLRSHASDLGDMAEVVTAPAVVHGDLSGNVFADPSGIPVVLDFSPFIRPKRYASAIVVADNLLWHDGDPALAELIDRDDDSLARALLFRLVSEHLGSSARQLADLANYRQALTRLGWA